MRIGVPCEEERGIAWGNDRVQSGLHLQRKEGLGDMEDQVKDVGVGTLEPAAPQVG